MEWIGYIGIGILVLLVLLVLVTNIQIVQQSRAYVVERLGAYSATWGGPALQKFRFSSAL